MTTVLGYEGRWFKSSAVPICCSWARHFIRIASTEGISSWRVFDQCYEPSRWKKNQCIYISVYSETIKSSINKVKNVMLWQSDYNHGHKRNALKLLQYHPYIYLTYGLFIGLGMDNMHHHVERWGNILIDIWQGTSHRFNQVKKSTCPCSCSQTERISLHLRCTRALAVSDYDMSVAVGIGIGLDIGIYA